MALDVTNFEQLVRIFVDTDVDTHFIVSISRTSTVAQLRDLVKVTHRHCYPGKGEVGIGQLAVPGGDYGYHLADFLRIGQVFDKDEGKVLAEVKSSDPGDEPNLTFVNGSTQVPLIASQLVVAGLELTAQKEGRDLVLGSADGLPEKASEMALLSTEVEEERPADNGGAEISAVDPGIGQSEKFIEEEASPSLTFAIKEKVSRKRNASTSNERPLKSRKLSKTLAPPADEHEENGRLGVDNVAKVVDGVSVVRSGNLDSNLLISSGSKKTKKKGGRKVKVQITENPVEDVPTTVEDNDGKQDDTGLAIEASGVAGLQEKLEEAVAEDNDVTPALPQKKRAKKREQKPEKKVTKRKKKPKKREVTPVLSASLNDFASDGQSTFVKSAVSDQEQEQEPIAEEEQDLNNDQKQDLIDDQEQEPDQEQEQDLDQEQEQDLDQDQEQDLDQDQEQDLDQEQEQDLDQEQEQEQALEHEQEQDMDLEQEQDLDQEQQEEQKEGLNEEEQEEPVIEQKPEKKRKKKKKKEKKEKKRESVSANHERQEADGGEEGEIGVTSALVAPVEAIPVHSQPASSSNEEVGSFNAAKDVEKKSKGKKLKKRNSIAVVPAVDACSQLCSHDSPAKLLNGEASEKQTTPQVEAKEASGEKNVPELSSMPSPKMNLLNNFNGVESSTSNRGGGTGSSPLPKSAIARSFQSQETTNSSEKAAASSKSRHSDSSKDVSMGEARESPGSEEARLLTDNNGSKRSVASDADSDADSGDAGASPGIDAHITSERFEFKPELVKREPSSGSSSDESSAESDPKSAAQAEVESQAEKEDPTPESLTPGTVKSPEKLQAVPSPKRVEVGDLNLRNDSLQFFSQDQSFQVAPTQVAKALSNDTTDDSSSDESDDEPDEAIEAKKEIPDNLGIGSSSDSSDESEDLGTPGYRQTPQTRTPVPFNNFPVSGTPGSGFKSSQVFKRRSSGVTAEIEARFAHFIESQDGLDELMGITLGQRKRSMPIEPSTQAESPMNTQESLRTLPGGAVGLEKYQAVDLAPASQASIGKPPPLAPQFKVPKPVVPVAKTTVAPTAVQSAPKSAPKELRLKRKDSITQVEQQKESKSNSPEKPNDDVRPSPILLEDTPMDDQQDAEEENQQTSAGNYDLLNTPEVLRDSFRDDATDMITPAEKTIDERKRTEENRDQDPRHNTDHVSELPKLASNEEETNRPSEVAANGSKERKRKGKIVEASQETSGFANFDVEKKKRKTSDAGVKGGKKKRKVDDARKASRTPPETSIDRSARETEELYLKLEKANREIRLRDEEERTETRAEASPLADGEDVAQSRLAASGEAQTDNIKVNVISDTTPLIGGNSADALLSPHLCAGTTEASDRQDEEVGAPQQSKVQSQNDVYDFVSEEESPMRSNMFTTSAQKSTGNNELRAKRLDDVASRAVQRVLDDDMLHVQGSNSLLNKNNSRKVATPINWTTRMRGSPSYALATSPFGGGTVPSDATATPTQPQSTSKPAGDGAHVNRGLETAMENAMKAAMRALPKGEELKPAKRGRPKTPKEAKPLNPGPEKCPNGCGRVYSKKSSAYYVHIKNCY